MELKSPKLSGTANETAANSESVTAAPGVGEMVASYVKVSARAPVADNTAAAVRTPRR